MTNRFGAASYMGWISHLVIYRKIRLTNSDFNNSIGGNHWMIYRYTHNTYTHTYKYPYTHICTYTLSTVAGPTQGPRQQQFLFCLERFESAAASWNDPLLEVTKFTHIHVVILYVTPPLSLHLAHVPVSPGTTCSHFPLLSCRSSTGLKLTSHRVTTEVQAEEAAQLCRPAGGTSFRTFFCRTLVDIFWSAISCFQDVAWLKLSRLKLGTLSHAASFTVVTLQCSSQL